MSTIHNLDATHQTHVILLLCSRLPTIRTSQFEYLAWADHVLLIRVSDSATLFYTRADRPLGS